MKKLILALSILVSCTLANAQVPVYKWAGKAAGTANEYGDIIKTDPIGNIYIAGRFDGTCDFDPSAGVTNKITTGGSDNYIAKYTNSGNLIWAINFGSTGTDRVYSIDVDAAGNVYAAGTFSLTADLDPGVGVSSFTTAGGVDLFFAKYDSSGNHIWSRSLGSTNTENCEGIALDASGNFYIAGEFNSPSLDLNAGTGIFTVANGGTGISYDPFLAKYDTAGNFLWGFNLGGLSSDYIKSLAVDANNNVLVGGYFGTTMTVDAIGGTTLSTNGSTDCFIARYSSIGNYDWSTSFGGTLADNIFSITTNANTIYATGTFNSVVDFNPGIDTLNIQTKGSTDVFITSFSNTGTFNWAGGIGGTGADNANFIEIGTNGDVYVAGSFIDSADFNPSSAIAQVKTYGGRDGFLASYTTSGNYKFALKIGSTGTDYLRAIAFAPGSNDALVTGYWTTGTLNVDPNNLGITLPPTGANDILIAKYGECSFPIITAQPLNVGTCPGGNASIFTAATGQNITYIWQEGTNGGITWTNITNGGVYSGATTPTLTFTAAGTGLNNLFYRCVVSADCGLNATSGVAIFYVAAVDTTVNVNGPVLVANAVSSTYQWLDCNNNFAPIPGATAKQFTATSPGSYALSVTKNGCNDTSACYTITTIGLNDIVGSDEVKIFPVPAKNEITIELANDGAYSAFIFDISGRKMLTEAYSFTRVARIPVNHLESGSYLVGIRKNDGEASYFKMVVE